MHITILLVAYLMMWLVRCSGHGSTDRTHIYKIVYYENKFFVQIHTPYFSVAVSLVPFQNL